MDLKGKVVLITGSSAGIGRETAYKFSREGCAVVITYRKDKENAEVASKKCLELGAPDVLVIQLDVTDGNSIKAAVKKIAGKFGRIGVLVNNAGVLARGNLGEQSYGDIESQLRINLEGLIKVTKECLPYVKDMIINIGSGAGLHGFRGLSVYCATKFGVRGFTQALAAELPGTRVYAVNPGTTATRMTGFQGVPAEKVAEVIVNTAKGKYDVPSGGDVNVWEHI